MCCVVLALLNSLSGLCSCPSSSVASVSIISLSGVAFTSNLFGTSGFLSEAK